MKPADIKFIKLVLDYLNERYPSDVDIPSSTIVNRRYVNTLVTPPKIFTANYSTAINKWWINVINYRIWNSEDFDYIRQNFLKIAEEENVQVVFCYVWYASIESRMKDCVKNKEVFIGGVNSKIKYNVGNHH